jgi:hypothetical protein
MKNNYSYNPLIFWFCDIFIIRQQLPDLYLTTNHYSLFSMSIAIGWGYGKYDNVICMRKNAISSGQGI